MEFGHCTYKWIDFLTPLDVLIGVRACIRKEAFMTFDVQDDGRLYFTHTETYQNEVRVVANDRSNWFLDADPQKVNLLWRFWIVERRPISRLTWDHGEHY